MRYFVFLPVFFVLLLGACAPDGGSPKPAETAAPPSAAVPQTPAAAPQPSKPLPPSAPPPAFVTGLDTEAKLNAWMESVMAAEGSYSNKVQTIQRGKETHKLMIFSDSKGKVRMVRAELSGGKQPSTLEFFLNDGKALLLRETLPGEGSDTENRFYSRQDEHFIGGKSRVVPQGAAVDSIPFKMYISKYGFDDFRLKPTYVQKWLDDYLKGK